LFTAGKKASVLIEARGKPNDYARVTVEDTKGQGVLETKKKEKK